MNKKFTSPLNINSKRLVLLNNYDIIIWKIIISFR